VPAQPIMLASAFRHVASRPTYASQSRSWRTWMRPSPRPNRAAQREDLIPIEAVLPQIVPPERWLRELPHIAHACARRHGCHRSPRAPAKAAS
jgi:hypothetical protein